MNIYKPVVLVILDGWGYQENTSHNAIYQARTPVWDEWWHNKPHMLLDASGHNVGLPDGQMGNSEVGHMHIGAGRIVYQDFTRINEAIAHNKLSESPTLHNLIDTLNHNDKSLHIGGLLSPGGVHSHEQHLYALLDIIAPRLKGAVFLHCFLDGRDTPPKSALESLERLQKHIKAYKNIRIATLCGRYYAMDRDKRWERIQAAYDLIIQSDTEYVFTNAQEAVEHFYEKNITDEFIPPCRIGNPAPVRNGDAFIFTNFRADRARQLTQALINPDFHDFAQTYRPQFSHFISMTRYHDDLLNEVLFPPQQLKNTLGEVIADEGLHQLRIAETEKYAHVTFFFNGGIEKIFPNEDRILINSPKVATYDLQPEMSAPELTLALIEAIDSQAYDFIVCNYANADMVGHTGNLEATVKAIECLDQCLGKLYAAVSEAGGCLLITADHGNAEQMFNTETGQSHTAHTSEPVPLLFIGEGWTFKQSHGNLIDIAPTVLKLMDIEQPEEMTGQTLLEAE